MRPLKYILFFIIVTTVLGCGKGGSGILPKGAGQPGELVLIIDSALWNNSLGDTLRGVIEAGVEGLPRYEPLFKVHAVHPSSSMTLLKQSKNLMFVFTLDQNTAGNQRLIHSISDQTLDKIKSDSTFHAMVNQNLFARDQQVLYLFGKTKGTLITFLKKNKSMIQDFFNQAERKRLKKTLNQSNNRITQEFEKKTGITLQMTEGFNYADQGKNFYWYRKTKPIGDFYADMNIFISWKPYETEEQFNLEDIIAWRDSIGKGYLFGDPEREGDTYVLTELDEPIALPTAKKTTLDSQYALEIRGLWKTQNLAMGGPFLGYALVDRNQGIMYYLEGFVFSPGTTKRELMRELETILRSFSLPKPDKENE